jgi:hypothetical protein
VKRTRIDPPHKLFAVGARGGRKRIHASTLIVELRPGVEVEIDLAPHPGFAGHLVLLTPPATRTTRLFDAGVVDDFAVLFGATNVLHVLVERRVRAVKKRMASTKARARR